MRMPDLASMLGMIYGEWILYKLQVDVVEYCNSNMCCGDLTVMNVSMCIDNMVS